MLSFLYCQNCGGVSDIILAHMFKYQISLLGYFVNCTTGHFIFPFCWYSYIAQGVHLLPRLPQGYSPVSLQAEGGQSGARDQLCTSRRRSRCCCICSPSSRPTTASLQTTSSRWRPSWRKQPCIGVATRWPLNCASTKRPFLRPGRTSRRTQDPHAIRLLHEGRSP